MPRERDYLATYVRTVWLAHHVAQWSAPLHAHAEAEAWFLPLVLLTACAPSTRLVLLTVSAHVVLRLARAPFVWESDIWACFLDMSFIFSALRALARARARSSKRFPRLSVAERNTLMLDCAGMVQLQLAIFYAASAFWKLNTAFLDVRTSCAPIFTAQLLSRARALAPAALDGVLAAAEPGMRALVASSPHSTVLVELAIPALLLVGFRRPAARRAAIQLALAFHLLVALTPPPNSATDFSVLAAKYLFFACAESATVVRAEAGEALEWAHRTRGAPLRAAAALAFVAAALAAGIRRAEALGGVGADSTDGMSARSLRELVGGVLGGSVDWCVPIFAAQLLLLWPAAARVSDHAHPCPQLVPRATKGVQLLLACAYAFGLPALGLQDVMATNMFSNLKVHGGSNHLLVPTGLLLDERDGGGPLGGGIVRVLGTTSPLLATLFPAEHSSTIDEGARALLHAVGHSGREWFPKLGLVLGEAGYPPTPAPPADEQTPYTVPAVELRRMIALARAHEARFSIEYTRLPGTRGDERWRATAGGAVVRYYEDVEKGFVSCLVTGRGLCEPDEVALQPAPPAWARKLLLFSPHPIIDDGAWGEVHCFG